ERPIGVTDVVEPDVLGLEPGPQAGASLPAPSGRVRVEPLARHARRPQLARPVRIRFHLLEGGIAEEERRLRLDPDAARVPGLAVRETRRARAESTPQRPKDLLSIVETD